MQEDRCKVKKVVFISLVVLVAAGYVPAQTSTHTFVPKLSTVVQTGGIAGINETHRITGQFQLTIDQVAGTARFDWVDATLSDSPFLPTRNLNDLFFMTSLVGKVVDYRRIDFVSPWLAPCPEIRITLTIDNGSAHLTGGYCQCVVDGYCFQLNAVARKIPIEWTYEYSDDFSTDKAQKDSYTHSIFWPGDAFPPPEPYLYYCGTGQQRALVFMDYLGQPAHLGYCFPIAPPSIPRATRGLLVIDVDFPSNAYVSQSPPGYLLYTVSPDGHSWSTPVSLDAGRRTICLESKQGTCYVLFLGNRAVIDNLNVRLFSPAATIYVPQDFPTIQQAIDAAVDGDIIEVAPGEYSGAGNRDIEFRGKAITVRSSAGAEQTIINCGGSGGPGGEQHRGFYFHEAEKSDSVLSGFTIRSGRINGCEIPPDDMRWNLSPNHPIGGGIYCEFSSPTIANCVIRNCGTEVGGGVGIVGGEPNVVNCLIESCIAGGFGGAKSGGAGGGIGIIRFANAKIDNCIIRSNNSYFNSFGGGVYCRRSTAVITSCDISFNSSPTDQAILTGGGVYCAGSQSVMTLRNCIVSHNAAHRGSAIFGEPAPLLAESPACRLQVINCTAAHNRLLQASQGQANTNGAVQATRCNIIIKNSIVWYNEGLQIIIVDPAGNSPVIYSDVQGGYPGAGNINQPPLFAPVAMPDYHLQSIYGRYDPRTGQWVIDTNHSPCIDAGDPNDPVGSEPPPNGDRINMGAYGGTSQASKGLGRIIWHVDGVKGSDLNNGLTRATAFATIQRGIDVAGDFDTVLVWPAVYHEEVVFDRKAITVQSAADAAVVTAPSGWAFSFYAGERGNSVLRNFVIRDSEYGIFCSGPISPVISNLTIVGNQFGIASYEGAEPVIENCILWDNTIGDLFGCRTHYSCVQRPGPDNVDSGNISANPLFADPNGRDYHLRSTSGRYWPQHNVWVLDNVTSPCIDAGDPNVLPARERMPNGGRLNMGGYGGTPYASMSIWPLRGDINLDGIVNLRDFAAIAESWLESLPWAPAELNNINIIMPIDGTVVPLPKSRQGPWGF